MSNDFPFNHFINIKNDNNNNHLNKNFITEQFTFPQSEREEKEAFSTENQSVGTSDFTVQELETIADEVLSGIKNNISAEKYKAFFEKTFTISSIANNTVTASVSTNFVKKMVETHYSDLIKQILFTVLGSEYAIHFSVLGDISNKNSDLTEARNSKIKTSFKIDDENITEQVAKNVIESSIIKTNSSKLKIDRSKSFDNFIVGHSNNMAHAFSFAVAKEPGKLYPQLYIHGNSGLGKTHLLHAICNHINEQTPALRICFTTANDFMTEMVLAIQSRTINEFRNKYTEKLDVLIIDDIHELGNKTRTQSEFFYIFNELQNKGKQLIFTSDKAPKEINGIEDRIRTRLSSALLIDIQQPDLETRIAILKRKAQEKDIYLDDEVINLIASYVKTNIRELEGNLVKLGAYSDLMNVDIDLEIAKEQLNLTEYNEDKLLTIESISKTVANYFKIALGDIKGKSRKKEVALARHISMHMSHKILKKTLEEIGEFFDNRDHSTVIHGIKKIEKLIKEDSKISQQIYEIESRL